MVEKIQDLLLKPTVHSSGGGTGMLHSGKVTIMQKPATDCSSAPHSLATRERLRDGAECGKSRAFCKWGSCSSLPKVEWKKFTDGKFFMNKYSSLTWWTKGKWPLWAHIISQNLSISLLLSSPLSPLRAPQSYGARFPGFLAAPVSRWTVPGESIGFQIPCYSSSFLLLLLFMSSPEVAMCGLRTAGDVQSQEVASPHYCWYT